MRIIFFGRQGAGKGTQCRRIAEHFSIPHISTGDMLREAALEGTAFGLKAKAIMDEGQLLPDDIMLGVITDRFAHDDVVERGFVLDGFPRTVSQAEELLQLTVVDAAVNLEVPEDVVLDRISNRRVCADGHIFAADDPTIADGRCPHDGTAVERRADDTQSSVTARLDAYATKTLLAVAWFDARELLVTVDGVGDPDDVFDRLVQALSARLAV